MLIHEKRYENRRIMAWRSPIRKNLYTERDRPVEIHRFLTRAKELFLGHLDNLERCWSRISDGSSGSLQNDFESFRLHSY